MINNCLNLIVVLIIIILLGFFTLAAFKNLIKGLNLSLLFALSWLTGCVVVSFSFLLTLLGSFIGLPNNLLTIIVLPIVGLLLFRRQICNSVSDFLFPYRSSLNALKTKWINTFSSSNITYLQGLKTIFLGNYKVGLFNYIYILLCILIILFCIEIFQVNGAKPAWAWDSWMIWSLKAKLLFYDSLNIDMFRNNSYAYAHLDYPLLVPMVQAFIAKFMGIFDERFNQIFFSLTYVSFLIITYQFIKRYINGLLSLLILIPIICLPTMILNVIGGYADGILATYHLLAVYFLYIYLSSKESDITTLIPVAIGLAGLLMTKNEGSLIFLVLLIIALLTCILFKNNYKLYLKNILITFLVGFLINLPWLIFIKINGNANDVISLSNISSLNIYSQLSNLPYIFKFLLFDNLLRPESWGLLFYIFILFITIGVLRKYYFETFFFVGAFAINFLGVIVVYLLSPHILVGHLQSSSDRVILGIIPLVICYMISILKSNNAEITA